jgi:long-chain acyl-CoA synthetase
MIDKYSLWRKNWPTGVPTRSTYPYGKMPIADYLKEQVKVRPNETAMNFYGREISFKEWDETADRLANALADKGYKKGDGVILYMYNCPQFCIAYIAAARLGLIIFPADAGFKQYELEYQIQDSGAKLIFAIDQNYPEVRALRGRTGIRDVIVTSFWDYLPKKLSLPLHPIMAAGKETFPDTSEFCELLRRYLPRPPKTHIEMEEIEIVLYTGGTTGLPKGCVHTHGDTLRSAVYNHQMRALGFDLTPCNSVLVAFPLSHAGALSFALLPSCVHGKTQVILTRYDPLAAMQAIEKYKIEHIAGTVPIYEGLLDQPALRRYDLSSVKLWECAEWMIWLSAEFAKKWKDAVGISLTKVGYGPSEVIIHGTAGTRIGYEIPFKATFMSSAVPPDEGIDVRIVDFDSHEDLPFGRQGEIAIKSPSMCKCYWNKPKETAEAFSAEGWFFSGDVGLLDEEGYLYWYGRKRSLIRVSGFQVAAGEIEMIGRKNPDIANIAVIGIPDEKKGQIPKAFVQLTPGARATEADIEGWFKKHISTYKVPQVEIRHVLPMTPKGSTDMSKLLEKGTD